MVQVKPKRSFVRWTNDWKHSETPGFPGRTWRYQRHLWHREELWCFRGMGGKEPTKTHQKWLNVKPERAQDVMQVREACGKAWVDTAQSMEPFFCRRCQWAWGRLPASPREEGFGLWENNTRKVENKWINKQTMVCYSVLWSRKSLVSQVWTPCPDAGPMLRTATAAHGYLGLSQLITSNN